MLKSIKYFIRVEGAIQTVYGFSSKKKAIQFGKNVDKMLGTFSSDFGTLTDGFLEYSYNKKRHGNIIDMRDMK